MKIFYDCGNNNWRKIFLGVAGPLMGCLACMYLYGNIAFPDCLFYKITGLYCPGCGSGRAVKSLLEGRFLEAVSYNIMLFILGIPCSLILIHEYMRIFFLGKYFRAVHIPQSFLYGCLGMLILFWILRNTSMFYYLAPL